MNTSQKFQSGSLSADNKMAEQVDSSFLQNSEMVQNVSQNQNEFQLQLKKNWGLKDRLKETVNEGSYQCYRAEKFINDSAVPEFRYTDGNSRKTLMIDKNKNYQVLKIFVTYEHLSTVSVNLKYLIDAGVLSFTYKWTWIISLYDLMVLADLLDCESDSKEYMHYRLGLYVRNDIEFYDEIDILGYFFESLFSLKFLPLDKQDLVPPITNTEP